MAGHSRLQRCMDAQVIFVMEDVDAAGSVVLRREEGQPSSHASIMHEALRALHSSSAPTGNGAASGAKDGGAQTPELVRLHACHWLVLYAFVA